MLKAAVSGSFHRHMPAIYEAVGELRALGVDVLSPSDPRVVDAMGEFLFVASDKLRSIKLVQDRHLEAIRASDFLWVVCPDGYTGPSTSGEILAASVMHVPVFSQSPALDVTIGQYVCRVSSMRVAIQEVLSLRHRGPTTQHVLIEPDHAINRTIIALERLAPALTSRIRQGSETAERELEQARNQIRETFGLR
jgi:hypothetical protein